MKSILKYGLLALLLLACNKAKDPDTDNVVYVGSFDRKLYAFDAATSTKKWEYDTGRTINYASPCVVAKDGTVHHAGVSGMVQ